MTSQPLFLTACAVASLALGDAHAQQASADAPRLDGILVTGKREHRVSTGATGLPIEIRETPQSISTVDQQDMADYGATGSNDALKLGTGITLEAYETNRTTIMSRGFEVQLTQIDGLGMTNDWGTVVGQLDTFLFDKIELIRGANGLLTGVGNASGTINYVRKRPKNEDGGLVALSAAEYGKLRGAVDYNKVLTEDGSWAARVVMTHENGASYLRSLRNENTSVYGVVEGQIGTSGVLTAGISYRSARQKHPTWGSLTLARADGSQADFDVSSSTSQDWTYWNTDSYNGFVEYVQQLGPNWEAKATYSHRRQLEDAKLFYAYSSTGTLNADGLGLQGWPYGAYVDTSNDLVDVNVNGRVTALGREHTLIAGVSYSRQEAHTDQRAVESGGFGPLPAFPYPGNAVAEPVWGDAARASGGTQKLLRVYGAARLQLSDRLKAIPGVNLIRLEREGSSRYGEVTTATDYPNTSKASPYLGFTYDLTPHALAYVSYSDIFQNQDQLNRQGDYLDPTKGVNYEAGLKADWLDRRLLTTFAVFTAEQRGIADEGTTDPASQQTYYTPVDVKSTGVEFEATGQLTPDSKLTVGATHLRLTGADGRTAKPWVPRTTVQARYDTRVAALPALRLGANARWQSAIYRPAAAHQGAFVVADAFAAYDLTRDATVRVNVNNLFDKKYLEGLAYGALYGAPRTVMVTLEHKL